MIHSSSEITYIHWLREKQGQPVLFKLLDKNEQQRSASYKFDKHRNLYIVAHVFLRKVLSYHADLAPEDWQFYQNSYGKPYIKNSEFQAIQFNLSHTDGMIVCAVNRTHNVGADVEISRPINYIKQMSRRNYTEREYNDIFSKSNSEEQLHRFFTYWTLKESLVKALGCGLSIPLKEIGFIQQEDYSWTLENSLKSYNDNCNHHFLFNHKLLTKHCQVAVSVGSDSSDFKEATFCYIDSNHKDSNYWIVNN